MKENFIMKYAINVAKKKSAPYQKNHEEKYSVKNVIMKKIKENIMKNIMEIFNHHFSIFLKKFPISQSL